MKTLSQLRREAAQQSPPIVLPSPVTIAKYGWSLREWLHTLEQNGWRCPICLRKTGTGKYVTDHEHVRGWKTMEDSTRKLYVRGITCWTCNRYLLARDISVATAQNVVGYLERYHERRPRTDLRKGRR